MFHFIVFGNIRSNLKNFNTFFLQFLVYNYQQNNNLIYYTTIILFEILIEWLKNFAQIMIVNSKNS